MSLRYLDLFALADKPVNALNKMYSKANEAAAEKKNYCFIHLNDGNVAANGLFGFSDGCIGSWSIGTAINNSEDPTALPLHFAHEMAHLLGYLNVVRTEHRYFSTDLAMCQHPPKTQLPPDEQLSIMSSSPNRQVIQQDIDNLNFGQGLAVDLAFWNKGQYAPSIFKNEFKYGIWEQWITSTNNANTEYVKKNRTKAKQ